MRLKNDYVRYTIEESLEKYSGHVPTIWIIRMYASTASENISMILVSLESWLLF